MRQTGLTSAWRRELVRTDVRRQCIPRCGFWCMPLPTSCTEGSGCPWGRSLGSGIIGMRLGAVGLVLRCCVSQGSKARISTKRAPLPAQAMRRAVQTNPCAPRVPCKEHPHLLGASFMAVSGLVMQGMTFLRGARAMLPTAKERILR